MNLLRKINRHIKLIERKIKREHSENKASFPEFCAVAHCLGPLTKGIPSESCHRGQAADHQSKKVQQRMKAGEIFSASG